MKPTERFSSRVDAYQKYRPDYPQSLVPEIIKQGGLDGAAVIADFGSGTGIFTRHLLNAGLKVFAVEPNPEMRAAAETALSDDSCFTSVAGSAEDSGLESSSVDLITAAQAFHWFNSETARQEFSRVLKPGGQLALIWNKRKISQPFQQTYDAILRELAPEYGKVNHMNLTETDIQRFFATDSMQRIVLDNSQQLDFAGLLGRLKSTSYCPDEKSPQYMMLATELLSLFDQFAIDGKIAFEYDTELYIGQISSGE
jgi:ubiquinone/menaquinone biosynthesis C-methylase UbiE